MDDKRIGEQIAIPLLSAAATFVVGNLIIEHGAPAALAVDLILAAFGVKNNSTRVTSTVGAQSSRTTGTVGFWSALYGRMRTTCAAPLSETTGRESFGGCAGPDSSLTLPSFSQTSEPPPPTEGPSTESNGDPETNITVVADEMPQIRKTVRYRLPGEPVGPWESPWLRSGGRADLVARGVLKYRGKLHVVLEIILQDVIIARAALSPAGYFCDHQTVGMRVPATGGLESRTELIKFDYSEKNWGLRVEAGSLESFAPRIESLREALDLQKRGQPLSLPRVPESYDAGKRFCLNREDDYYSAVPIVVRIDRRRTSEPIVHVQWFCCRARENDIDYNYGGTSLMSWRDTVTLAKYSELYAKFSLPDHGWIEGIHGTQCEWKESQSDGAKANSGKGWY